MIGGKLKESETIEHGMVRELKEEIDIDVKEEDLEIVNVANTMDGRYFIQIGLLVKKYLGVPKNMEPNKCDDLRFFSLEYLPELFSGTKSNIMLWKKKRFYDKKENIE